MKIEFVKITPQLAKQYLTKNSVNRKLTPERINLYTSDMKKGNWFEETAEAIKFSKERLIDGQHRLHAIIKSGITVKMLVVSDIPDQAFSFIDQGKARTSSDVFTISGIKNGSLVSAIIKNYLELKNLGLSVHTNRVRYFSNDELLKEYNSKPEFYDQISIISINYYKKCYKSVSPSWIGGWYVYLMEVIPEKLDIFFDDLFVNRGAFETTDVYFDIMVKSKISQDYKISTAKRDAFMIKTLNSYLNKKPLKILKYNLNDVFPQIAIKSKALNFN